MFAGARRAPAFRVRPVGGWIRATSATGTTTHGMTIEHDGDARHAANAWFRARRERRIEPPPTRRRRVAITIVALLHVALLLALRAGMRVDFERQRGDESPLVVRFDEAPAATADDPALAIEPPVRNATAPASAPRVERNETESVRDAAPAPEAVAEPARTSLRLFEPDGSLRLSDEVVDAARPAAAPAPRYRERERRTNVWRAERPRIAGTPPTRFDRHWKPDGENLAEELVRKYPLLGLILQNPGGGDRCPPRSIDPDCEGAAQPAFPDDPYPDDEVLR